MYRYSERSRKNLTRVRGIWLTLTLKFKAITTRSQSLDRSSSGRAQTLHTLFFCLFFLPLSSNAASTETTQSGSDTESNAIESTLGVMAGVTNYDKPFNEYTWVTAHNAYLDNMQSQLDRGVRAFMLDLYRIYKPPLLTYVGMCHGSGGADHYCPHEGTTRFADAMNNTFIPFLKSHPNEVVTLILEAYVDKEAFVNELKAIPGIENMIFQPSAFSQKDRWPTLREIIASGRRIIITSAGYLNGAYTVNGSTFQVLNDADIQIQNTYDLGANALDHNWVCETRWKPGVVPAEPEKPCTGPDEPKGCPIPAKPEKPYPGVPLKRSQATGSMAGKERLFVMNQIHSWMKSEADAGNIDNNLTYLERRVERYCRATAGERLVPNFIAIDYSNVGDAIPYAAALNNGGYYFYEDNNANTDQDTVCVLPAGKDYNIKLASHGCENDEARSLVLRGIASGSRLTVYDSPEGNRQDDYSIIDVKRDIGLNERIVVNSFERTQNTDDYSVRHFNNNGLDGKISRIHIEEHPVEFSEAAIVLHEGNNGSQNIVCSVGLTHATTFDFGGDCDNDETRSATLSTARAGTMITVYGNWGSSNCDQGCSTIEVKRNITWPKTIGTYENHYEDADIKVSRSGGTQQLDGKISSIRVAFKPDTTPPSSPAVNPSPVNLSGSSATVEWAASTDNTSVTGYTVSINNALPVTASDTRHIFTGLNDFTLYNGVVRAQDAAGNHSEPAYFSFRTLDETAPTQPGAPVASDVTGTSATISWPASTDNAAVTGYTFSTNNEPPANITSARQILTDLSETTSYTVEIKALDAAGNQSTPAILNFQTRDVTPPTKPGNLQARNVGLKNATFNWNVSTDNVAVTGYKVYLEASLLDTVTDTTYALANLTVGKSYTLRVVALDADNNESEPATLIFSTLSDTTPPDKPTALNATNVSSKTALLLWNRSTDDVGINHYEILRNEVVIGRTESNAPGYLATDLTAATNYKFSVRALDSAGNRSALSDPLAIETSLFGPPTNPRVLNVGRNRVDFAWNRPVDAGVRMLSYKTTITMIGGGGTTTYDFPALQVNALGLRAATRYLVSVRAYDLSSTYSPEPLVFEIATEGATQ
jgi:chitodextrinase